MNMKNALVLFTVFCLPVMLCAQGNYEPGYIITNQQDTVTGWINYRTEKNNQKQCEFKPDLKHETMIYLPEDIAGYRFTDNGKYYVSREIQLNEKPQKVFLEFLVEGMMNLYYYEDVIVYYFFENQEGKMEIVSRKPERIDEEKRIVRKDNAYIGQVRYLFRDYQPIAQKANNLKFDQKSMIGVVKEYHKAVCTTGESCIIFQNERPDEKAVKCKISIYGGLQQSKYTFSSETSNKVRIESNVSPVLGVQVNLLNPRWSKSFSIQLDASLSQFRGDPKIYRTAGIGSYKSLASSVRLGVKYTYPKYRIAPTVEAGLAYTYLSYFQGEREYRALRHRYTGYYSAVGADYRMKASQAIFIRLVYEDYPFSDGTQLNGRDKICLPHMKVGYTF